MKTTTSLQLTVSPGLVITVTAADFATAMRELNIARAHLAGGLDIAQLDAAPAPATAPTPIHAAPSARTGPLPSSDELWWECPTHGPTKVQTSQKRPGSLFCAAKDAGHPSGYCQQMSPRGRAAGGEA